MTKLLEQAIAKVRELPEADQDDAAELLLSVVSKFREPVRLDDETRAAIREGLEQARVCQRRRDGRVLQAAWCMRVRYTPLSDWPFIAPMTEEAGVYELSIIRYPYTVYYRVRRRPELDQL